MSLYGLGHLLESYPLGYRHAAGGNQGAGIRPDYMDADYSLILFFCNYFDKAINFANGV
jgi:hypothetical protein